MKVINYVVGFYFLCTFLVVTRNAVAQNVQQNNLASIIPLGNHRIGHAQPGAKLFSDQPYVLQQVPSFLQGLYFSAGSMEKGLKLSVINSGKLFVVSPEKKSAQSQDALLLRFGFSKMEQPSFQLFAEQTGDISIYQKDISASDTLLREIEWAGWAIAFFSVSAFPSITMPANIIWNPGPEYAISKRLWQGCPSITRTGNRFWTTWFSGGAKEPDKGNYGVVGYSDNGTSNWKDPVMVVVHPNENVRVMDTQLWTDPEGKLWLFWTQNTGTAGFDGLWGTWASCSSNPNSDKPDWTSPRRLCDGLTRNKPTVLSSGEWLLPSYNWIINQSAVYVSTDKGITWSLQGGPINQNITFYEHMVVEKKDKSLWMLQRSIRESYSTDKGKTWTSLQDWLLVKAPSSRLYLGRLRSGSLILVYNDDAEQKTRKNMTVALSDDDGKTWPYRLLLDERTAVSYPDLVEDNKGRIIIVYDRSRIGDREIIIADITEKDIRKGKLVSKKSVLKKIISKL